MYMDLKDLIKNQRGLGDTVRKVTEATKVDKLVEKTTAAVGIDDCGCSKRQEKLNKIFPYNNNNPMKK